MPDSMIAIISNAGATGRRMKGRDGLMDALLSGRSRACEIGCHWARRDCRPPFGEPAGAVVAFPGVAFPGVVAAGAALRSARPGALPSVLRGTTLAPLRSLSAPSTTTRSAGLSPD